MTTARRRASRRTLALVLVLAPATAHATYSVVATDRATGQVGGAVTSCVGSQGVGVVYRPSVGHGGVNAQASASATGRDRAVVLLGMDVAPADIITMITAASFDSNAAVRQYGVVDLMGRAAGFTGGSAMNYKEDRQGSVGSTTYSVQGNILTSRAVIDQAESAFRNGGCDLADKLMRALEGGAMNGEGDSRCTSRGYPSDAASIEVDLTGEPAGSYLKLSVAGGNMNAVTRMRTMFDAWRTTHPCAGGSNGGAGGTGGVGGRGGVGGANGGSGGRGGVGGMPGPGGTSGAGAATGTSGTTGSAGTGAGGPTDAGTSTPGDAGGCSCAVSARPAASSFVLLLTFALLRRRRRR
jgi:MYXO-CTERM domain-containing protein